MLVEQPNHVAQFAPFPTKNGGFRTLSFGNTVTALVRSLSLAIRPKPVDHRIEKRPFNACWRFSFTAQERPRRLVGICTRLGM